MKIEIGRRYVMRNGFVTPPIVASTIDGKDFPFGVDCGAFDGDGGSGLTTWTNNGLVYSGGSHPNAFDLINQFVGDVKATWVWTTPPKLTQYGVWVWGGVGESPVVTSVIKKLKNEPTLVIFNREGWWAYLGDPADMIDPAPEPRHRKTLRLWFVQQNMESKWLPEWVEEGLVPDGKFVRSCDETCLEGEETI